MQGYNAAEKYELVKELISPHLNGLFVTPKDIDETVKRISYTISEALNMLFQEDMHIIRKWVSYSVKELISCADDSSGRPEGRGVPYCLCKGEINMQME